MVSLCTHAWFMWFPLPRQPYPFIMMYGCHPLFICKSNAFVRLVGLTVRRRMARRACGSRALAWAGRPCAARAGDVVPAPAGHLYLIAYMLGNIMLVHARSQTQQHAERTVGKRATDPITPTAHQQYFVSSFRLEGLPIIWRKI